MYFYVARLILLKFHRREAEASDATSWLHHLNI